jgi:hypothetical protein
MTYTRTKPIDNPTGETPEQRGATRYLGAMVSFAGFHEQERSLLKKNTAVGHATSPCRRPISHSSTPS